MATVDTHTTHPVFELDAAAVTATAPPEDEGMFFAKCHDQITFGPPQAGSYEAKCWPSLDGCRGNIEMRLFDSYPPVTDRAALKTWLETAPFISNDWHCYPDEKNGGKPRLSIVVDDKNPGLQEAALAFRQSCEDFIVDNRDKFWDVVKTKWASDPDKVRARLRGEEEKPVLNGISEYAPNNWVQFDVTAKLHPGEKDGPSTEFVQMLTPADLGDDGVACDEDGNPIWTTISPENVKRGSRVAVVANFNGITRHNGTGGCRIKFIAKQILVFDSKFTNALSKETIGRGSKRIGVILDGSAKRFASGD